ncbi:TetR/AcrR family transcriptional regulator [Nonomuraea soli]|uniref:AcrR family transcriptional regulator n=1 Tax=Nonomuraea soli TaxID=1032476 RepID=A0A7W0CGK3_9ACTN|nr:TetR/AcrR family transcriptional regulator [Nonomuraea soli]MBA2890817.1 AcrR family transcriptional regulator [Nonomuraea soli]
MATRLFAELGYDSTSTQILADATGMDTQTLTRRTGGRRELYRMVMRQAFQSEQAMVARVAATAGEDGLDPHAAVDAYLDFYAEHPLILSLWMHRWMGDAADVGELEAEYVEPQVAVIAGLSAEMVPPDVNVEYLVRTVVWCVFGFLTGGMSVNGRHSPSTGGQPPAQLEEFRRHLHTLIDRMLAPR